MSVYAVVLAGGQGSRLGDVRKAELRLGGRTMLERVLARLPADIILSTGQGSAVRGYESVRDAPGPGRGPLAGLAAAVQHLRGRAAMDDVLLSVAVDTPFLPSDFSERLEQSLTSRHAVFAAWGEQIYPTNAAYRFGAIADLSERMEEFGSPKRLQAALGAMPVFWESAENPFANLNTLTDLVALARRA